jgi:magnesium and cobalt transporter
MKVVKWFKDRFTPKEKRQLIDDLEDIIDEHVDDTHTLLLQQEKELIANILSLRDQTAENLMAPRPDLVTLSLETSYLDALKIVQEQPFARFPVYGENLDDIRGFIQARDIIGFDSSQKFSVRKLLKPILFAPHSIPVLDLLLKMQDKKTPIVAIIDEYGGVDGLITTGDIMRELLGDITIADEPEDDPLPIQEIDGKTVILDARTNMDTFTERYGPILTEEEQEEDIDTVNGLILFVAGRVPNRSEVIQHASGLEFEILEATPRAVSKVKVVDQR